MDLTVNPQEWDEERGQASPTGDTNHRPQEQRATDNTENTGSSGHGQHRLIASHGQHGQHCPRWRMAS
jgi:hypothetical protein